VETCRKTNVYKEKTFADGVAFATRATYFSLLQDAQTDSGAHPTSYEIGTGGGYFSRPRVEVGYNTSTVVPASRKRRRRGNTFSDETVMYGYWSSVTGLAM
jgi:hypothetical protein